MGRLTPGGGIQVWLRGEWRRPRRLGRTPKARVHSSAVGASIEASKALRGWVCGEWVSPPHRRRGLGRGQWPLPRNFFPIFDLKKASFGAFETEKTYFWSAWRLDCFGQQPSRVAIAPPPVDPPMVNVPKLPLPVEHLDPHLKHGSLSPPELTTQTASQSVQLFLQDTSMWPTNRQTDTQTNRATCDICSNMRHLCNACDAA